MKIIKVSNFDNESVSDMLIAENVIKHYGELIVDFLNNKFSRNEQSMFFYKLESDDYKLYKFEP